VNAARARRLVLCADDYGLSPGVSRGIVELIAQGRLSATSCMSVSRFWPEHAAWLKPFADKVDVGLHLTLTNLAPLGPMPLTAPSGRLPDLSRLARSAILGRLDQREVAAEFERQVNAFERAFGHMPAFLDGHQHVHQLPIVRDVTIELLSRRLRGQGYVRNCAEPLLAVLARRTDIGRALMVSLLGRGFAKRVRLARMSANDSFRGVYDLTGRIPYATLFPSFLSGGGERPLVMCHPGHVDPALGDVDPVTDQRETEWQYFSGDGFLQDLGRAGLELGRFHA
jgi:predicted glycoside hydrolase/deacetylase ChbG (UPF0249 family)